MQKVKLRPREHFKKKGEQRGPTVSLLSLYPS